MRNAIVSLVIKGRDEAGKVIDAVRKHYRALTGDTKKLADTQKQVTLSAAQSREMWQKAGGDYGRFRALVRQYVTQQEQALATDRRAAAAANAARNARGQFVKATTLGMDAMIGGLGRAGGMVRTVFNGIRRTLFSMQSAVASLGISLTAAVVTGFLVKVNREYGKLLTQLRTFEGSSAGARAVFRDLAQFALKTPFQISELVQAYITLRTAGITPTMESLTLFGDHAAAMGHSIVDFAEAIRSGTTGEMERLKQFGVVARLQGEKIIVTFQGQTKVIGRSAAELTAYLEDLSRTNFAGGMERQSKTLDGAISNLQGAFENLARAIGDAGLTDWLVDIARAMSDWTTRLAENDAPMRRFIGMVRDSFPIMAAEFRQLATEIDVMLARLGLLKAIASGSPAQIAVANAVRKEAEARLAQAEQAVEDARRRKAANARRDLLAPEDPLAEKLEIDRARRAQASGGLKSTGRSAAPSTVFNPKEATAAEDARKKEIGDLEEQVNILIEQIDLRAAGVDALERALALEQKLAVLMGKTTTTEAERWGLIKTGATLRATRRGAGIATPEEALHDTLVGQTFGIGAVTPESVMAAGERVTATAAKGIKITPPGYDTIDKIGQAMKDAVGEGERLDQIIADMTTDTFRGFGDAVESAFVALADGSVEAGHAFSAAMLGALGEVASGFGQFFMAKATAAWGDVLLGNPAAAGAAIQYTAGAGAMFAIAGAFKGQANVVARRGSRGGGAAGAAVRDSEDLGGMKGEVTVYLPGGFMDPQDPRWESAFIRMMESLSDRNVRIVRGSGQS